MSSIFRKFFGGKKESKGTKRAISRRLELLGLEDRIVPATISVLNNQVVIQLADFEDISDLNTSVNGSQITINTVGSQNNTGGGTGLTVNNNSIVVNTGTGGLTGFAGISVLGFDDTVNFNSVTVGAAGIDLSNAPGGADQLVSINLTQGSNDADVLNVNGVIKSKGTGGVTLNASAGTSSMTIAAAGDITTNGGAVNISSVNLTSSGDITTGSGNISFGSALNLGGDVSINSTSGNVSAGIITPAANNLTINAGSGTVTLANSFLATSGNLSITTTNATASAISIAAVTTTGSVSLNAAGNISVSGAISAASVNAKSTAGDVMFDNTVTTTGPGGFTSEATSSAKATKITDLVDVQNGANALVTGNLVAWNDILPEIRTTLTGTIAITGKVDGDATTDDLTLTALNGDITIGGAVGASGLLDELNASGKTSFTANGTVTAASISIGFSSTDFAKSINFADAVKATGSAGFALAVDASGTGTINFSKGIEITNANADMYLNSVDGDITVTGNIISNGFEVYVESSGAGSISIAGISTISDDITVTSGTGNITISGAITTGSSYIEIDTITSGDIVINGNVSAGGGAHILLGADFTQGYSATGTGNLTINGTVSTTSGDIVIGSGGTGTVSVNKALTTTAANGDVVIIAAGAQTNSINFSKDATITSAASVIFKILNPVNTVSFASGANISAATDITDTGNSAGNLNLANNLTTTNGLISLNSVSVSLAGPVSMKAGGQAGNINLGNTNGAQNLTLETTGNIVASSSTAIGGLTPLASLTVVNSANSVFYNLNSASVTISDTTSGVDFLGNTVISKSLTTAAKAYSVAFIGTTVLSGLPEFKNTGITSFSGNTSLTNGATITGDATSGVTLGGTIVSGGAFNIGEAGNTGGIQILNGTQLILNSTSATSTFAKQIVINGGVSGAFELLGVGTLTLSGDSSATTTGDSINVTNGTLNVTGKIAAATSLTNGTISGAGGTIGALNTTIGNVTPSGKLTTGAITLGAATNYNVAITGATIASNLETGSAIKLGNAVLNLTSVSSGLQAGNQLTIINNTVAGSGNAIVSTFANLPEGSTVSAKDTNGNTVFFSISYKGADGINGNDAVLTVLGVQTTPLQPMVSGQPVLNKFMVVGADAGGGPQVTLTFPDGTYTSFFAYDVAFTGGVCVAAADVNGDGNLDIVTGAGAGGGPNVKVFAVDFFTGAVTLQTNFFAFGAPNFTGGVYVAAGDTNADGFDDVIVGAGATGGSRVQVYAGSATGLVTGSTLNDFFAYSPAFTGGVVVAAGFRDGNAGQEVVTAPASNGGFNIRSFDVNGMGNSPTVVDNFFAFNDSTSVGGLSIALQDLDAGATSDIIIGSTNSKFGVVLNQTGSGNPTTILANPFPGFTGAIRAGVAQTDNQNYAVAAAGPGGGPVTNVYSVVNNSLSQTDSLFVLNPQFTGGLFVSS